MAAIKKSQLYSSIWEACDELRGGMDASQYKDYVLIILFVRYVSDKYAGKKNSDVIIPKGGSFDDLIALKGKAKIGEEIDIALAALAKANGLGGVFSSVSFNDPEKFGKGQDMVDTLSKLIGIFQNEALDFSKNRAEGDDLLGDAYEYLMKHFAVESGKSKGQFYTPAEVSRIIAHVISAKDATGPTQTVYDPTCGSGSLLLKVAAETTKGISIYGQEKETATTNLAILNMWLHSQPYAKIRGGQSTLSHPLFTDKHDTLTTFDYVVANPPFSYKAWRNGFNPDEDQFERFTGFGVPPTKNGDYAFLLHILRSMKSTGKGAVILPHGVLFRGNTEADIRTNVVNRGYIKAIIGLPGNLFYGTGIPACIIVLDKKDANNRKGIFMIDASRGFIKDGNKNRLREQDIKKIIDAYDGQLTIEKFSRFVPKEEIEKNEYNLNLPRYIDTQPQEDRQDIEAHLRGGIPNLEIDGLAAYWEVCPTLRTTLFRDSKRKGYSELNIPQDEIRAKILSHDEFSNFRKKTLRRFSDWREKSTTALKAISTKDHPKVIIGPIANTLLDTFEKVELIDKYDAYQHLMTYWGEVMQDDAYIITVDDWKAGNDIVRLETISKSGKNKGKKKEVKGLAGLEGKLIPIPLILDVYFRDEKDALNSLHQNLERVAAKMTEIEEEHGGEEGHLSEAYGKGDKITKGELKSRIKEIKNSEDFVEELAVLNQYLALIDEEDETKEKIKIAEAELETKLIKQYPKLTIEEIKNLVVEQKWMNSIEDKIREEIDRYSEMLAGRIKTLSERYEMTLPEITKSVDELSQKVDGHLKKMGFVW